MVYENFPTWRRALKVGQNARIGGQRIFNGVIGSRIGGMGNGERGHKTVTTTHLQVDQ